ncbi:MAG: FAD-binding oxidoreductase [Candidatus Delongbacteria bacterium]
MISKQNKYKLISVLEHKNYEIVDDSLFVFPDNMNMLSSIIKLSNRFGIKIVPIGYGSSFDKDFSPSPNSIFLSSQKFNKMTDLDKNNSFIQVQSGHDWSELSEKILSEGLYFPLKTQNSESRRTIGGIFSSIKPNSAASNYFTGIEFFAPDASVIKYGTKTLKNVSGYDIIKFMAGSMGSYGFITSLTLKLSRSASSFFIHEELNEISLTRKNIKQDGFYKRLKSVMDPNLIFE